MPDEFATRPFQEELPRLLAARSLSLRALARDVGVGHDHLSRVVRGGRRKHISGDLASRVAVALGLGEDFFLETRLSRVVERLASDPALLHQAYEQLRGR